MFTSLMAVALILAGRRETQAFRSTLHCPVITRGTTKATSARRNALYSSIGGSDDKPPSGGGGGGENRRSWDDFLNREGEESENLLKAREYISESSLPISYGQTNDAAEKDAPDPQASNSSALVVNNPNDFTGGLTQDVLSRNPYMAVVSRLSPSDLISKFTATAHPRVQNAVRSTILGLIGGLPKMAFDTTTITTGQKLASLMFQLQMTGYMFKVRCCYIL